MLALVHEALGCCDNNLELCKKVGWWKGPGSGLVQENKRCVRLLEFAKDCYSVDRHARVFPFVLENEWYLVRHIAHINVLFNLRL